MNDDAKQTLTPRLRFPEFRKGWDSIKIADFFDLTDKAEKTKTFDKDRALTVRLHTNGVVKNGRTTLTGGANYFSRKAGQFIFSKIDLLNGAFGIVPKSMDGFSSSTDVPAYSFSSEHSSTFFFNWLKANYERLEIERTGTSSTLKRVSPEKFLALEVLAPAPAEQQKIADCLTSLDDCVAAQGRKVETLKAHKKGLMQQLFPREGETFPRLRFPEFRDKPEWEAKPLNDCFSHIRNGFVGTATPFYVSDGVPYLQGKNVKKGRIDPTGLITISPVFHDKQRKSHLRSADIIMVQSGHVGECALVGDAYAGSNCHALIIMTPRECQHSAFFVHCFGSDYGLRLIAEITTGNTIEHILASEMKALVVHTPQLEEQQRIAACLSSLDARIAAEGEKLAALKTHKKGLMQQLFPSPKGEGG